MKLTEKDYRRAAEEKGWRKNGSHFVRHGGVSVAYFDWVTLCWAEGIVPEAVSALTKQGEGE